MIFKAKIKDSNEWIEGSSLIKEESTGDYVIARDGCIYWIDSWEWNFRESDWEFVDSDTIEIIH